MRIPKTLVMKAIRENCLECCGNQYKEVKLCPAKNCKMWMFRFGGASIRKVPELAAHLATLPKFDAAKVFTSDPVELAIRQANQE
jgi:hypothetical protein